MSTIPNETRQVGLIREVDDSFRCIKCDTSGNPILRAVESIYIDWRYLTREEKPLVCPMFLSDRPPFEGILFRQGSTNIIRAPSWAFNGSTVCIPERRVSADTLFSSCNRVALRKSIPLSHRVCLASPPAFLRFVCRIASLRDRSLQARRRHGW